MATGSSASLKPILVGSCYRPPSSNSQCLDNVCEMLDHVCDINRKVYSLGDLNIKLSPQEKASNCNQCLQPGSGYQSTYQCSYKQHRNEIINM